MEEARSSLQRKTSGLFISSDSEEEEVMTDARKKTPIAQRKKMPTPSPSGDASSRSSLDESVYSSLSNEVYSKISSRGSKKERSLQREIFKEKIKDSLLTSESASVLEVIEPSSSEGEDEHWPITIFPSRSEDPSSMITITSSPRKLERASTRSSSKTSHSSGSSPTKRLMEMGINVLNDDEDHVVYVQRKKKMPTSFSFEEEDKKPTLLQKIANKIRKPSSTPPLAQALPQEDVEEHILPDSFDELTPDDELPTIHHRSTPSLLKTERLVIDQPRSLDTELINRHTAAPFLSPSSRRAVSSMSSTTKSASISAASVATSSEDSGIGRSSFRVGEENNNIHNSPPKCRRVITINVDEDKNRVLTKIDEASSVASSSRCSGSDIVKTSPIRMPKSPSRVKRSNLRAWYDVPSDEDHEAPEADSLASIISHRSSSEEELYK